MLLGNLVIIMLLLIITITSISLMLCGKKWSKLSKFFHQNYSFFEIVFVFIYFIEQFSFIVLSYIHKEHNLLLTGVFAIVVISTVSLQKVMMECKNKKLQGLNQEFPSKIKELKEKYEGVFTILQDRIKRLQKEKQDLIEYIHKNLK